MKKLLYLFLLLLFAGCIYIGLKKNSNPECEVYTNSQLSELLPERFFNIQKVSTEAERSKGLSGKKCIPEDQAMLFVFDKPDTYGFWMKDMNFSIDIIWLDADKEVVFIQNNATPESYPHIFKPKDKSLYVLEVASGMADSLNITIGTQLNF